MGGRVWGEAGFRLEEGDGGLRTTRRVGMNRLCFLLFMFSLFPSRS